MKTVVKKLLGFIKELILDQILSGLFAAAVLMQFISLFYLAYVGIYEPIAAAPGARDGMGLILVLGGIFLGVTIVTSILASIEARILKRMFPWWYPPEP